jgi:hypothetical protein
MTLDEAREHIGDAVVYDPGYSGAKQDGTITGVNNSGVFVRYGHNDSSIQLTPPGTLTLLAASLKPRTES